MEFKFKTAYQFDALRSWPGCRLAGDGPFAVVALCCKPVRVWLFPSAEEASAKLRNLSEWMVKCDGRLLTCTKCQGDSRHEVHKLEPPVSFADRMEPDD